MADYRIKYTGEELDELLDKVHRGEPGVLQADLTTTVAIGRIPVGTTFEAGTSIETILRALLSPEIIGKTFSFVSSNQVTEIIEGATENDVPSDFASNGITLRYATNEIQYEYFAYPASFGTLTSIIQNGSFDVKDAWTIVATVEVDGDNYYLYRTIDGQGDDDSSYKFIPGGNL